MNKLHLIAAVGLSFSTPSCCIIFPYKCCEVDPPELTGNREMDIAGKAAADALNDAIVKGSIEGKVKHTVKYTYDNLGDSKALLLLLRAANCASARGDKDGAAHLRESARLEMMARNNRDAPSEIKKVEATPASLTPVEERLLKDSPLKEEIIKELPQAEVLPTPSVIPVTL
jgi:hypothetical protein